MLLADALARERNNLDIFRLLAAALVIWGHAYPIFPHAGQTDWLLSLVWHDYSGSFGLKLFFFISGLVVSHSLFLKRSAGDFLLSRFLRLWPALTVLLVVCAFAIGPLLTTLPASAYFAHPEVRGYVGHNLMLDIRYLLPGVFENQAFPSVNGSLWSLPYEVSAYFGLLIAFGLGLFRWRWLATALLLAVIAWPLGQDWLGLPGEADLQTRQVIPCFFLGTLLVLWRDRVRIGLVPVLVLWLIYALVRRSRAEYWCLPIEPHDYYAFLGAVFATVLWLATRPALLRLRSRHDVSYGAYLWGWPVQQWLVLVFPAIALATHQATAIALAVALGAVSWFAVERPAMNFGKRLLARRGPVQPS